jgi:hypothetical protein
LTRLISKPTPNFQVVQVDKKRKITSYLQVAVALNPVKSCLYVEAVLSTFSRTVTCSLAISYPTGGVG